MPELSGGGRSPRPRGRPPQIDRPRIVAAARTLDSDSLTMQAVAEALGVNRKALNYHVRDREGLLKLVAASVFESELTAAEFTAPLDWRDALRELALTTRVCIIATGAALAAYVRFDTEEDLNALAPSEATLERLIAAGFDTVTAGRALCFVMEVVYASALNALERSAARGEHPQTPELRRALETEPDDRFTSIRSVLGAGAAGDSFDEQQLEFNLRVLILGLERLLPPKTDGPGVFERT